jgi:hypothetical protein
MNTKRLPTAGIATGMHKGDAAVKKHFVPHGQEIEKSRPA